MLWILFIFMMLNKKHSILSRMSTISLKVTINQLHSTNRQLKYHKCVYLHQWVTYFMNKFSCMAFAHTHTRFGSISLQLLVTVVHLLDDEVGPRVFSQVVVISYHPAPLGVPLLLPVHSQ